MTGSYSQQQRDREPPGIAGGEGRFTVDTNQCATKDVYLVPIVNDVLPEFSETFRLGLSNPVGLWVARTGRATILNSTFGAL